MIKIINVSKEYGENQILDHVSFDFNQKKIKIKGDNGVGKSVLLKILVGYTLPDEGEIYYEETKQLRKDADFLEDAGISINAPEFMKQWTGLENLLYLSNITKKCSKEKIMTFAKQFDLEKSLNKKYKTYSLGMKQKMRLIQAFMDEPRYLILDEPFDALDENTKQSVKAFMDHYLSQDEKRMLIYTSHSEEDDEFATQILYIKDHKLQLK